MISKVPASKSFVKVFPLLLIFPGLWSCTVNTNPQASFIIHPIEGNQTTVFSFNAAESQDAETPADQLLFRWDWETDGQWDTEYGTDSIAFHQYSAPGDYIVKLEALDSDGGKGVTTHSLLVYSSEFSFGPPSNPRPGDDLSDCSTVCALQWDCNNPLNDSLLFDVYFGVTTSPTSVARGVSSKGYTCPLLSFNTVYYWKVVAKDNHMHLAESPLWSFTTNASDYPMGTMTDSRDGREYKTVQIVGQLWMAQNLNFGEMIHATNGGDSHDGYSKNNGKAEKYCYRNDSLFCAQFGGLYSWDEAMLYRETERTSGICPVGWHLPSNSEWKDLTLALEPEKGDTLAGTRLIAGSKSGFEALFAGYLIFAERSFYDMDQAAYFWSSTMDSQYRLVSLGRSVFRDKHTFYKDNFLKYSGLQIRCVKDVN